VAYTDEMMRWEAGPRETDGVWAKYWYSSVEASTGFGPYVHKDDEVPDRLAGVLSECEVLYAELAAHRLGAA
jgi:hypothetical protein